MAKYASKVIELAVSWLGLKESNGTHKPIIDIYNTQKPLPIGYKLKYTDAWCAGFVSAVAIKLGYTDIIPCECSCTRMITLLQKKGIWVEDDSYVPKPGDIIFYDWDDSGKGDNQGSSDHVGYVEKVVNNTITVIEGNYSNAVKRRTLAVNGRYIRGYGVPKYDPEPVKDNDSTEGEYTLNQFVKDVQKACGAAVDGIAGNETISKTVTLSAHKNTRHAAVRAVQKRLTVLGYVEVGKVDGIAGMKFTSAVAHFQQDNGCVVDGEITARNKTWRKLLGME